MADKSDYANNRAAKRKLCCLPAAEPAPEHSAETESAEGDNVIHNGNGEVSRKTRNMNKILISHYHFKHRKHRRSGNTVFDSVAI